MKHLPLLALLLSLLYACSGDEPPPPPTPPKVIPAPTPVSAPEPEATPPATVPPLPPENSLPLTEFRQLYEIDALTGLSLDGNALPRQLRKTRQWPDGFAPPQAIYDSLTGASFSFSDDEPLFLYELHPGEFLLGSTFEELTTYTNLTVVDSSLRVITEPRTVDEWEPGLKMISAAFTEEHRLLIRHSDWIGDLNDTTKLYRNYGEAITFLPGGQTETRFVNQSYHVQQPYTMDTVSAEHFTCDVGSPEMAVHNNPPFPVPAEALLAPNSIGVVTMLSDSGGYYRLDIRFPGELTDYAKKLLGAHYLFENPGGNQYTEDMTFSTTPVTVSFYDTLGQTITVDTFSRMRLRFYCENDGPMIVNPSFELRLRKTAYPGLLAPLHPLADEIVAVAVALPAGATMPAAEPEPDRWDQIAKILTIREAPAGPALAHFYYSDTEEDDLPCLYFRPAYGPRITNINCCGP